MRLVITLTISLFLFAIWTPRPTETKVDPRHVVESFLKNWLEKKDFAQVKQSFAEEAFTSKVMLSVDCAGYIADDDRSNPRIVESKVMKLLRELSRDADGRYLKDILKFEQYADNNGAIGSVLASPQKDGYMLVERANVKVESEESERYISERFPSDRYLAVFIKLNVRDKEGKIEFPIYFIWARHGAAWKIVHLDMVCI